MAKLYWARRPMGYAGQELDFGQIFEPAPEALNNEKLERLGYMRPIEKHHGRHECNRCDARFIGLTELGAHGRKRHPSGELTEEEQEARLDAEERRMAEIAPLNLDRTAASLG